MRARFTSTKLRRHALLTATAAVALLLTGCEVGPDYKKPDITLPAGFVSQNAAPSATITTAETWWTNFNDPVLTQLIMKAAQGNLDVKIAETRIDNARAQQSSAFAALLPTGDFQVAANRQANRIAFPDAGSSGFGNLLTKPFNTYQTGFDASWELDLFGGHRRQLESADATLESFEATRDDTLISLMAEVARTYVDIRQYQAQIQIAKDTIDSDTKTAGIAKQRFTVGDAPRIDLTQAEAELEQEQAQLPYYENLLAQTEFSMDVLLGEQPGVAHQMVSAVAPVPTSDVKLVLGAPASVIANRPDIRVAERKLAATTASQGAAVAQFFPDISLSGFLGLLNTSSSQLLKTASQSWMVGGSVVWPILSYGSLSANLDAANAAQAEAFANYQKTVIEALSDVERSYTAYVQQAKYQDALEKSVSDTRHYGEIARQRYKEGLTSFLEVLDAERTLYASESRLAESNAQTAADLVAVYKSLGGGWVNKTYASSAPAGDAPKTDAAGSGTKPGVAAAEGLAKNPNDGAISSEALPAPAASPTNNAVPTPF